jgi:type I restriction enzyme, S subunit
MQLPIVKTQADRWARGAAQPTINLKELKEFKIPVPPLPLQEKFAALVTRHERLHTLQRESLRQAEHLFQTLLHQAFSNDQ